MTTAGGPASYVELVSCLEVLRDAKSIEATDPLEGDMESDTSRADVNGAPRVRHRRAGRGRRGALWKVEEKFDRRKLTQQYGALSGLRRCRAGSGPALGRIVGADLGLVVQNHV
jgi:hypothetical protein